MSKNRILLTMSLVFLGCLFITAENSQASHPYHVSNAEVNFNAKTGNFEVALCVWPSDLEKAIGIDQQAIVDLDKTENLDDLMKSYIKKRFLVRSVESNTDVANGVEAMPVVRTPAIRWIGHERDLKAAWLYFEVECDESNANWTIENRVFFELNEDQLNQLELSIGKASTVVVCRTGDSRFKVETSIGK